MANKVAPQKGGLVPGRLNPQRLLGQKPPTTPAKPAPKPAAQPKPENRFVRWYRELRTELRKVVWPSRETAINLTILVIVVCVAVGIFLGVIDFALGELLTRWLSAA